MDHATVLSQLPALRRYARVLTGNRWAADDLVQDTLERACSKWRLWLPGTDLRAWLFTLMHRIFLNQQRSVSMRSIVVPLEDKHAELADCRPRPDITIDLERCLALLPPDQRTVLLLVTVEDLPYAQAAQVLGVPVGTVMSRLSRARTRLRELMDGGGRAAHRPDTPAQGSNPVVTFLRVPAHCKLTTP